MPRPAKQTRFLTQLAQADQALREILYYSEAEPYFPLIEAVSGLYRAIAAREAKLEAITGEQAPGDASGLNPEQVLQTTERQFGG